VRSLYAGTVDGDPANLARVSMRITRDNGSDDMFTTGQGAAFVPLLALHATNHNWFRLADFPVHSLQRWTAFVSPQPNGSSARCVRRSRTGPDRARLSVFLQKMSAQKANPWTLGRDGLGWDRFP
jgi:hypothetical protein